MGGPKVFTRFGRRDAGSSADGAASPAGRLVDERRALDGEDTADYLRRIFADKGFSDRELVALQGWHTVGQVYLERTGAPEGAWTAAWHSFDNMYYSNLVTHRYAEHGSASGLTIYRSDATQPSTLMLPTDLAMLKDDRMRTWVERYAADPALFATEFAAAWTRLQELGCSDDLVAHPSSLSYASGCYLPNEWIELPMITRREMSHDATLYGFGLPPTRSLDLPVCACLLLKAPAGARKGKGKDDGDVVRPYTPVSDPSVRGRFELLVRRYEDGVASQYLHGLRLGSRVAFRHIRFNIKAQYPFDGKQTFTFLCAGSGITPIYQAMWKLLHTKGDHRKMVLIYGNKSPSDILLKAELDAWARENRERLTLVYVVGNKPGDARPSGWEHTDEYTADVGWIDRDKVAKYAYAPSRDTQVVVCGLPAMYKALCGPREEAALREGCVLDDLGYSSDMVAKM